MPEIQTTHTYERNPNRREAICKICGRSASQHGQGN